MTDPSERAPYLNRLHARLRLEGHSPGRRAAAMALGTFIGCLPIYGLHLALTTVCARLLGLSRVLTYLAAHLNNPLTAPFLLYVEQGVGHWLLNGSWPELSLERLRAGGALGIGLDLALGSLVLGAVLGLFFGLITLAVAARRRPDPYHALCEAAAEPYLRAGVVHWEWVRGKLRHDPIFRALLEGDLAPRHGRLVDLGCGRGGLLALLAVAAERTGGPVPELEGVELRASLVKAASIGLEGRARVIQADLAEHPPPPCDGAFLLDVLHYLPAAAQDALLARAASALRPGGVLLIREADADAGWRFLLTRIAERVAAIGRGHLRQRFAYRSLSDWRQRVERLGLVVDTRPMSAGTPFGNVLLVAVSPKGPS